MPESKQCIIHPWVFLEVSKGVNITHSNRYVLVLWIVTEAYSCDSPLMSAIVPTTPSLAPIEAAHNKLYVLMQQHNSPMQQWYNIGIVSY